jgi:uncharacterized membrane protein
MDEWFISALRVTTRLIEIGGIAIIVIGLLAGTLAYLREMVAKGQGTQAYSDYRSGVGRAILLGLEFLVAAVADANRQPVLNPAANRSCWKTRNCYAADLMRHRAVVEGRPSISVIFSGDYPAKLHY